MSYIQTLILIAVMSLCTFLTRALPFILFPAAGKIPAFITYLGKNLPRAIIGMLIVYCLKDMSFRRPPFGLPELAAVGAVILLYTGKRNSLLAIAGGTAVYMFLR
jgi:branched-subunit amino acid transport protein AzlD